MNAEAVQRWLRRMAGEIAERLRARGARQGEVAVVGIRPGGAHLARRLCQELAQVTGQVPPLATLQGGSRHGGDARRAGAPGEGPTGVGFPIDGKAVVLVDDVLRTGETVRAALDELLSLGRPRQVWLSVLVDRGGRELPIAPDFVGCRIELAEGKEVEVRLREDGACEDQVAIRLAGDGPDAGGSRP